MFTVLSDVFSRFESNIKMFYKSYLRNHSNREGNKETFFGSDIKGLLF